MLLLEDFPRSTQSSLFSSCRSLARSRKSLRPTGWSWLVGRFVPQEYLSWRCRRNGSRPLLTVRSANGLDMGTSDSRGIFILITSCPPYLVLCFQLEKP